MNERFFVLLSEYINKYLTFVLLYKYNTRAFVRYGELSDKAARTAALFSELFITLSSSRAPHFNLFQ